ncbi:MAG: hypothetical protein Q9222_002752, partial [Ikaeria aurantiellina]
MVGSPSKGQRAFLELLDTVVTVVVGKTQTPFHVHKGLLCSKSAYFNAAFNSSFKEAVDGSIRLIDEDPNIFRYYILWVYNQPFDEDILDDDCFYLYLMADRLGSEVLQNLVMDIIWDQRQVENYDCQKREEDSQPSPRTEYPVQPETITHVYENTLPGSMLRSILVDCFAWNENLGDYPELVNTPPEFLYNTLKTCTRHLPMRLDGEVAPFEQDKCK